MRITLAQVDAQLGDIDANVERAARAITSATQEGTDLIVFPELQLSGYSIGEVETDPALRLDDERLDWLAKQTGDSGVVLTFPEASPSVHTYNSAAYYEAGQLVHVHRKLYLPNYLTFEERKHFTPGQSMRAFDTAAAGRISVMICNDAWQPQLAFLATQDGAHILVVPVTSAQSAFPERYESQDYWRGITRFYGRMCQLFVVFVNRVGAEGAMRFWGGSHVVDPWGNVIAEAPENEEHLLTIDIDLSDVRRRRRDIPLVKEARLGLVHREVGRLLDEGGDL